MQTIIYHRAQSQLDSPMLDPKDFQTDTLVNADEMARLLGRHRQTVLKWGRDEWIPRVKMSGRIVMFSPREVWAAIQKLNRKTK